jgi:hypothetical protein
MQVRFDDSAGFVKQFENVTAPFRVMMTLGQSKKTPE